ncbi:MAG: UDP-3-O-acyl-N-acetylglucosamine deacetylase [Alphaproteobacteria bacterium]|nr:UDP-3-O-acyl-N-acetylglucosamine deacetylase [Alphaproteobacteria bacterium]
MLGDLQTPPLASSPVLSATQKTLAQPLSCEGEGVHNGKSVRVTINPAPANTGIIFERTDVKDKNNKIPALWNGVRVTPLCTQILNADGIEVRTIEHLMAALFASGIDNAHITIGGAEVPIMDGSSLPFLHLIAGVGVVDCAATDGSNKREFIKIIKPVEAKHGDAYARLLPAPSPRYSVTVAYPQHNVGEQHAAFDFEDGHFIKDVASARTFGFKTDLEYLHAKGLALGGNFSNAILINEQGKIMNPGGYRSPNELARHKLLDAIGDMALAGGIILGHMESSRSGHTLNNALLRALFADPSSYRKVVADESMQISPVLVQTAAAH